MKRLLLLVPLVAGCATSLDPNYALQLDSYRKTVDANAQVAMANARADEARWQAIAEIAAHGDIVARQTAIIALAMGGRGSSEGRPGVVVLPTAPESQEERALKWAAIFAGPITSVAQGFFGYRLGVSQSNNQANTTIASYNALGLTAASGYAANSNIAGAGFSAVNTAIAQIPGLPNQTTNYNLNGTGVIGSGSYVGPNSGAYSGNFGRLLSPDTRNCTGGNTTNATTGPVGC